MVQTPVFLARSSGSSPSEAELGWESEPSEGSWEGKGRCYLNSDRGVKERVTGQGEAPPGHRESQDWGLCLCWAPSLGLRGTEGSWARPVAGPGERRGSRGWGGRAAGDRVGESGCALQVTGLLTAGTGALRRGQGGDPWLSLGHLGGWRGHREEVTGSGVRSPVRHMERGEPRGHQADTSTCGSWTSGGDIRPGGLCTGVMLNEEEGPE